MGRSQKNGVKKMGNEQEETEATEEGGEFYANFTKWREWVGREEAQNAQKEIGTGRTTKCGKVPRSTQRRKNAKTRWGKGGKI